MFPVIFVSWPKASAAIAYAQFKPCINSSKLKFKTEFFLFLKILRRISTSFWTKLRNKFLQQQTILSKHKFEEEKNSFFYKTLRAISTNFWPYLSSTWRSLIMVWIGHKLSRQMPLVNWQRLQETVSYLSTCWQDIELHQHGSGGWIYCGMHT